MIQKLRSHKKGNNKGFTLVELIVVLVILAILAAILVPALLGYIDRAKQQQIVLNAKSCLTAAQAELSSMYGQGVEPTNLKTRVESTETKNRILNTADVSTVCSELVIGTKGSSGHDAYTVSYVLYAEGADANKKTIYFDGKAWVESPVASGGAITMKIR